MKIRSFIFLMIGLIGLMGLVATVTWFWPHGADYYYDRGCERLADSGTDERWLFKWDLNRALAAFNHAIELNPRFASAYENRAAVRDMTGDWRGALADYTRAIELNPQNVGNYKGRAGVRNVHSDIDGAMADYARALELSPNDRTIYMTRSRIKEARGDLVGAMIDRARIGEIAPPISSPMSTNRIGYGNGGGYGYGMGYGFGFGYGGFRRDGSRGVGDRRLTRFDRVLELNTNFSWGFYHRGIFKSSQNDWDGALADFRRCEELPDDGLKDYSAIQIWLVQAQSGKEMEANQELAAYLAARPAGPTNGWPSQIARYLLNQTSETNLFAAISPSDLERQQSQFWYYAGMKQLLAGDKTKAADDFRKALDTKTRPYAVFISARMELAALRAQTNADVNP